LPHTDTSQNHQIYNQQKAGKTYFVTGFHNISSVRSPAFRRNSSLANLFRLKAGFRTFQISSLDLFNEKEVIATKPEKLKLSDSFDFQILGIIKWTIPLFSVQFNPN
jgi:hypothetical protein